LFGDTYRPQIAANLVRLDAFLSDLAEHSDPGPGGIPEPAYCTVLAAGPGGVSARAELLNALVIQWLTVQVTRSGGNAPAVIVAGADDITRSHLERLADACDRRDVPLTLLFRHLRNDAIALIGGGAAAFMRLGNHSEAEQAASFIGRRHKFVLAGWTATHGGEQSATRGHTETWGTTENRGFSSSSGWTHGLGGSTSGGRGRSRDYGRNYSWAQEFSQTEGTSWSRAENNQRVYEFAVEPRVLQNLPDTAMLLCGRDRDGIQVQAVDCHPGIITLPGASTQPLQPAGALPAAAPDFGEAGGHPQIEPRPQWLTEDAEGDQAEPAWHAMNDEGPVWPPPDPPDPRAWRG
jgi:hypothetical protein